MAESSFQRFFTPEEANAALGEVRPAAERMATAKRALDEAQRRREDLAGRAAGNGGGIRPEDVAEAQAEVERQAGEVARCLEEIASVGALVKDLDAGLVDFPALRRGEEVLLCWRVGEEEVAWWHRLEDGFAGRRPLPL